MLEVFFTQYSSFAATPGCPLSAYRRAKLSADNMELRQKQVITEFFLLKSLRSVYDDIAIPLNIQTGEYGKPYLPGYPYQFNISHSKDLLVCGISDLELGVDVEKTVEGERIDKVASRFFSEQEQEYIRNAENKEYAFTEIWTLKEAFVKALGTGGSTPLESFSVLSPIEGYSFHHEVVGPYHFAVCVKADEFPGNMQFEKISFNAY